MRTKNFRLLSMLLCVVMLGAMLAGCNDNSAPATGSPESNAPSNESADAYPSRPIEVISQFGAGGGTDIFIRAVGVDAGKLLGQSVVPISATGGGGLVAYDRFSTQPADGYTLYAIGPEQVFMHVWDQLNFEEELEPVIRCQMDTSFLYAKKGSQFTDIDTVVEYAKANPGKLNVAITGAASYDEVLVNMWAKAAGIDINLVVFGSGSESIAALLGGHVDILHEEIGPARSLIDSGDAVPLVAFTDEPITNYDIVKDVPTSVSKGWDVTIGRWRGFAVKKGTDPAIIEKLYDAFSKAMEGEIYQANEKENMLDIRPGLMNGEDFKEFIQSEIDAYSVVMDELDIKPAA
ncbi:MAG: Bug family tripartite tricarboxylate transporter substrate binding protein [Candidatus Heteroscillospira sp.]|jgi:putative tricarboxylic transport membrane protein